MDCSKDPSLYFDVRFPLQMDQLLPLRGKPSAFSSAVEKIEENRVFLPIAQSLVEIRNFKGDLLFCRIQKKPQEIKDFFEKNGESIKTWNSFLSGSFAIKRMTCLAAKDLFFPTTIHFASKVHHKALRILSCLGAIFWDLLTMPSRFFTLPFRLHFLSKKENRHPLLEILSFASKISNQPVRVSFKIEEITEDGDKTYHKILMGRKFVALESMPTSEKLLDPESFQLTFTYEKSEEEKDKYVLAHKKFNYENNLSFSFIPSK